MRDINQGAAQLDLTRLDGNGRRRWSRRIPTVRRPCRVTARNLGDGVAVGQVPLDLSLGGCALAWKSMPPARGTQCMVEFQLPVATVLLSATVVHVRRDDCDSGVVGLRFLPGAALEAALIPLDIYLLSLDERRSSEDGEAERVPLGERP
jgi:c-di-GMP-binding flagellar brake protein YcgR